MLSTTCDRCVCREWYQWGNTSRIAWGRMWREKGEGPLSKCSVEEGSYRGWISWIKGSKELIGFYSWAMFQLCKMNGRRGCGKGNGCMPPGRKLPRGCLKAQAGGCGGKRKMEVTLSKSPSIYHKTETKRFKILLVFLQFVLLLLVYIYSASSMAEFLLKAHL